MFHRKILKELRNWEEIFKLLREHDEWEKLQPYLYDYSSNNPPNLQDVWNIMDQVWKDMGLSNRDYAEEDLSRYYSHPIWFFNGLFIEAHKQSMLNRRSLASFFKGQKNWNILDYGGGFGTLAKEILKISPTSNIDIYEPYAKDYAYENVKNYSSIKIRKSLKGEEGYYDALVNTDVLEHVEKPIKLVAKWNKLIKKEGVLISHWHFESSIKCHLPKNFHYRYTFGRWVIPSLGFSSEIKSQKHGHLFRKESEVDQRNIIEAQLASYFSRLIYPLLNLGTKAKILVQRIFKGTGIYLWIKNNLKK